jgi:hypothetical protein
MFFWDVAALKRQLTDGALTPRAALKYVLAFVLTVSVFVEVGMRYSLPATAMDSVAAVANIIIIIFGTLLVYSANGGDAGADFLGRYVALSWVLGVRVFVGMMVLMVAVMTYFEITAPGSTDGPGPVDTVTAIIAVLANGVLYWRLALHIRQVAFAAADARGATAVAS